MKEIIRSVFVGVVVLASALPVAAAPITYTERIEDLNYATFLDLFDATRNLTRTRTSGGPADVETDDPTIVSEHLLSDNWGFSTGAAMTWQHLFPAISEVDTYLQGKLTIEMIGVDADLPDLVFVESFFVGALLVGGMDTQSTTTFSTDGLPDPDGLISLFLADGKLDVGVLPLIFDHMTIRSSTLEVTYEPFDQRTTVPEPTTAVLLLSGAAVGAWRRRQARR
jgi:PEP-CTERM motif